MKRLTLILIAASLAACAGKKPALEDFDRKLDDRLLAQLEKRVELIKGNPQYSALVSDLTRGRGLLSDGKPDEAFVQFDKILQNSGYQNFPEYSFAKYYLATTLYELGVNYGALLYFVDIVQNEPLKPHTHESLRRAISIAQKLKDDELILYLASSISPDKVPLSLREEFRYFIGKDLYLKAQYDKAAELLDSIPHRNRLHLAAQYLVGTLYVQKNDLAKAIQHFRNISNNRSPVVYYEDWKIRELTHLALGRIFYEQKNYPLSVVYYKKIDRKREFFPTALYESAWALFKLNKFNEALAVLHSLNSPFFDQTYFLKSQLLKGAILIELCQYDEAVQSLSVVEKRFSGLKNDIDRFARQAQSPREYYPILASTARAADGNETLAYGDLFKLSSTGRDFLGVHRYIRRLGEEQSTLDSLKSPRGELLAKLLKQKATDLVVKASYLAGKRLRLTRELIAFFENSKDIIRYEIISAERKILQTRSLRLAPPVLTGQDLIRPEFTESLRETLVWWDWNGEYWQDEVGYYLYEVPSRCKTGAETPKP